MSLNHRKFPSGIDTDHRKETSADNPDYRKKTSSVEAEHRKKASANGVEYRKETSGGGPDYRKKTSETTGRKLPPNHLNEPLEGDMYLSVKPAPTPKRSRAKPSTSDQDFAAFWLQFPRKVGKTDARKAYDRAIRTEAVGHPELMTAVMRYAAERTGEDPQFTKHPSTWLNKGCWTDEPAAVSPPSAGYRRPGAFSAIEHAMSRISDDE